jgi:hypothetical protein
LLFDWLFNSTAAAVLPAIAGFALGFLLVSPISGEIFDFFDGGLDHDFDHDHGGPSLFSSRGMGVFMTARGRPGAISTDFGLLTVVS